LCLITKLPYHDFALGDEETASPQVGVDWQLESRRKLDTGQSLSQYADGVDDRYRVSAGACMNICMGVNMQMSSKPQSVFLGRGNSHLFI